MRVAFKYLQKIGDFLYCCSLQKAELKRTGDRSPVVRLRMQKVSGSIPNTSRWDWERLLPETLESCLLPASVSSTELDGLMV